MDPLTKEERESFRQYAGASLEEPDGSECQWANHTLRLLDEADRLREDNARLRAENERLSKLCCVCEGDCCRLAQERLAEVKRLEGLILNWESSDVVMRDASEVALYREARRIRGEK